MNLTSGLHQMKGTDPERIVTTFGKRILTYGAMFDRVARMAAVLREYGVSEGDRVSMLALNSDKYLEFYFAAWWCGAIASPLNTRWSAPELIYAIEDADCKILLVDDSYLHMADSLLKNSRALRDVIFFGESDKSDSYPRLESLIEVSPTSKDIIRKNNDPAAIFYTGGTTGIPKGVVLSHGNFWSAAMSRAAMIETSSKAVVLHSAPFFHVAAMGRMIAHTLIGGSAVILPSFQPLAVLESIERHAISELVLIPSMLQSLIEHSDFDTKKMSSVRRISYGGSSIPEDVLDRALLLLPRAEFIHTYGMTEAPPPITLNPHLNHIGEGRKMGRHRSAGRPANCVQLKIIDERGCEVKPREVGEVVVRGPNVMLGYWGKPEETSMALHNGWLHTGDGGYLDEDGYLYLVDRLKDMIISGGENVYSAEVENAIAKHPYVVANAVIGIPNEKWGEGVHAVIVLKPGTALSLEEIQDHCKKLIAGYKCPISMEFRDRLPMSPVGKVLKTTLREPYWRKNS